jgi:hypothetical protein
LKEFILSSAQCSKVGALVGVCVVEASLLCVEYSFQAFAYIEFAGNQKEIKQQHLLLTVSIMNEKMEPL